MLCFESAPLEAEPMEEAAGAMGDFIDLLHEPRALGGGGGEAAAVAVPAAPPPPPRAAAPPRSARVWHSEDVRPSSVTILKRSGQKLVICVEMGTKTPSNRVTHVVVTAPTNRELAAWRASTAAGRDPSLTDAVFVPWAWVEKCLKLGAIQSTTGFEVGPRTEVLPLPAARAAPPASVLQPRPPPAAAAALPAALAAVDAAVEGGNVQRSLSLACQPAARAFRPNHSFNIALRNVFVELAALEAVCPLSKQNEFKKTAFQKAANAIGSIQFEIECMQDARTAVAKLGWQESSSCSEVMFQFCRGGVGGVVRLQQALSHPPTMQLRDLCRVWNVGEAVATELVRKGITSVALLREAVAADDHSGQPHRTLHAAQRVGLRHLADFELRIPRGEIDELYRLVLAHARILDPQCTVTVAGSYRRNCLSSGDVDMILCSPNNHAPLGLVRLLVAKLMDERIITDELKGGELHDDSTATWNGVYRMPQSASGVESEYRPFRRLDLKFYPPHLYHYALLYFTGSGHFNRSMRYYADRVKHMTLSDKGLVDALEKRDRDAERVKADASTTLPAASEEEIFAHLQLEYVAPADRSV